MNFSTQDFFHSISELNVLVIGDVMIDRYLSGTVDRISPEAPVPVVAQVKTEDRLGGAANVALNILALGASPILCGIVGKDKDAVSLFSLMENSKLKTAGIISSSHRCTTMKTRIIADRQHLLRLDNEVTEELNGEETDEFVTVLERQFAEQKIDAVILQDYNKGVLSKKVIEWVIDESGKRKIPVAVDPKFKNFWAYKNVDLFKPNLREIQDALKKNIPPTLPALQAAAAVLSKKLNHKYTLITLSEHGVFGATSDEVFIHPIRPRKVADVCGAGDAVISMAVVALALGLDLREIAALSNLVGGQVVERLGVVPIDKKQLEEEMLREIMSK